MQRKCYCQLHLGYILVHCENITIMPETNLFATTSLNLIAVKLRVNSLEWSSCAELDWEIYSKNLLHCFVQYSQFCPNIQLSQYQYFIVSSRISANKIVSNQWFQSKLLFITMHKDCSRNIFLTVNNNSWWYNQCKPFDLATPVKTVLFSRVCMSLARVLSKKTASK